MPKEFTFLTATKNNKKGW